MYAEEDQLDFGEEDVVDAAPAAEEEAPVHLSSSRPSSKTGETTSSSQPRLVDSDPNSSSAVDVGSGPSSTAKPSTAAESKGEDERFKEAVDAPVGSLLSRMSDRPVADEQLAKRIDEAQPPLGSTTAWERSAEVGKRQVKASPGRREDVSFAKQSDAQGADSPSRPIASKKSLPEGWEAVASRTGGDTYFFNSITGESQWDVPQAPATNSALRAEKEVTQDTVDLSEADRRLHADSSKRVTASVAPSPEDRPRRDARDAPQILSIKGSASRSRQLSPNSLQQQQRKRGLEQLDKRAHDSASEAGLSIRGASSASTTQRSVEVPSELPFNSEHLTSSLSTDREGLESVCRSRWTGRSADSRLLCASHNLCQSR
ncbi:hypothetical protein IE81DRAFT_325730 [Ceraceosorus guamensis]|uniref:WW domain-containing protein n=1 Tax=Ceraceosorus guamensis TaxID=1522189 RepID=A0A316VRN4_9BASI|nr:hypothetical protein IE81DRAFT_325730 [Ceraceosorus guamensis]PWN40257.1 hypothetical protein IE81DRAFT_325730 [Ceraceosorus guamensis]